MKIKCIGSHVVHGAKVGTHSIDGLLIIALCDSIKDYRSWNVDSLSDDTEITCMHCIKQLKKKTTCPTCGKGD